MGIIIHTTHKRARAKAPVCHIIIPTTSHHHTYYTQKSTRKGTCMSHHHTYYVTSSYILQTKEHAQRHLYVTSSYLLRHIIIHTTDKRARAKAPVCHIIIPTTSHHHTYYRQK